MKGNALVLFCFANLLLLGVGVAAARVYLRTQLRGKLLIMRVREEWGARVVWGVVVVWGLLVVAGACIWFME